MTFSSFNICGSSCYAEVKTDRLVGKYVSDQEIPNYCNLFGNKVVMEKYATGETWKREKTEHRVNNWIKRWKEDKNPFTALAFHRKLDNKFICHIVVGGGDDPGTSEMAYVTTPEEWRKRYTSEAVSAVVNELIPLYLYTGCKADGMPLQTIYMTVRPDNPGSVRVAELAGLKREKTEQKYGSERWVMSIGVNQLIGKIGFWTPIKREKNLVVSNLLEELFFFGGTKIEQDREGTYKSTQVKVGFPEMLFKITLICTGILPLIALAFKFQRFFNFES